MEYTCYLRSLPHFLSSWPITLHGVFYIAGWLAVSQEEDGKDGDSSDDSMSIDGDVMEDDDMGDEDDDTVTPRKVTFEDISTWHARYY